MTDIIRFDCPGCGKIVAAPAKAVGRNAKCPKCGVPVTVPSGNEQNGVLTAAFRERAATVGASTRHREPDDVKPPTGKAESSDIAIEAESIARPCLEASSQVITSDVTNGEENIDSGRGVAVETGGLRLQGTLTPHIILAVCVLAVALFFGVQYFISLPPGEATAQANLLEALQTFDGWGNVEVSKSKRGDFFFVGAVKNDIDADSFIESHDGFKVRRITLKPAGLQFGDAGVVTTVEYDESGKATTVESELISTGSEKEAVHLSEREKLAAKAIADEFLFGIRKVFN